MCLCSAKCAACMQQVVVACAVHILGCQGCCSVPCMRAGLHESRSGACACSALAAPVMTRGGCGRAGELKAAAMVEGALDSGTTMRCGPLRASGRARAHSASSSHSSSTSSSIAAALSSPARPPPARVTPALLWQRGGGSPPPPPPPPQPLPHEVRGALALPRAWVPWLAASPCHPLTCWVLARHAGVAPCAAAWRPGCCDLLFGTCLAGMCRLCTGCASPAPRKCWPHVLVAHAPNEQERLGRRRRRGLRAGPACACAIVYMIASVCRLLTRPAGEPPAATRRPGCCWRLADAPPACRPPQSRAPQCAPASRAPQCALVPSSAADDMLAEQPRDSISDQAAAWLPEPHLRTRPAPRDPAVPVKSSTVRNCISCQLPRGRQLGLLRPACWAVTWPLGQGPHAVPRAFAVQDVQVTHSRWVLHAAVHMGAAKYDVVCHAWELPSSLERVYAWPSQRPW